MYKTKIKYLIKKEEWLLTIPLWAIGNLSDIL